MAEIVFYLFASILVGAAFLVITLRNPVYNVLFLILSFFSAASLFILLGAEFIAMTLVIVYVGAVAVLFLFVVMMLNINVAQLKSGFIKNMPIGLAVGALIFVQLYYAISVSMPAVSHEVVENIQDNTRALGMILYTDYFLPFQLAGIILLVAMIGAIVLTLLHGRDAKRQNITQQLKRSKEDTLELRDVKFREGVKF